MEGFDFLRRSFDAAAHILNAIVFFSPLPTKRRLRLAIASHQKPWPALPLGRRIKSIRT
jgi:hypothetical protein